MYMYNKKVYALFLMLRKMLSGAFFSKDCAYARRCSGRLYFVAANSFFEENGASFP